MEEKTKTKTKIELSEIDVYFLTKDETKLLWDYDVNDSMIWEKRTNFFNAIRKPGRYVLAIDITGVLFCNFFKPKTEGEAAQDVYAISTDINCNLREFNEWIKAKYKERFEEELCLTEADEEIIIARKENQKLSEVNRDLRMRLKHLETAVENSNAKSSVDAIAEKKGVLLTDFTEDKDGLNKAQKLIFRGKDPFEEDEELDELHDGIEEDQDQEPELKKETDVNNWRAMYETERTNARIQIQRADAQFKNLLDLFNSREND